MRYQERVAVITGSSAGIGAASVRRLASEGVSVVVNGRSADKLERFASELLHRLLLCRSLSARDSYLVLGWHHLNDLVYSSCK